MTREVFEEEARKLWLEAFGEKADERAEDFERVVRITVGLAEAGEFLDAPRSIQVSGSVEAVAERLDGLAAAGVDPRRIEVRPDPLVRRT
jgi:hypothetical protein